MDLLVILLKCRYNKTTSKTILRRLGIMILKRISLYSCIICFCFVLLAAPKTAYAYNESSDNGIEAVTRPSKDVTLSFVQPGRIDKVNVKEGDAIKAGQLLVQLDDAVEQAQLAQLKAQSENTTRVEASQANLDQKRIDLDKFKWAAERGSVTKLELEHRKLDVKIAELSLEIAKLEHEQDKRKYSEAKIRIDRMQLKSPIDGRVEEIHVEPGESVNSLADVVRVVETNPFWIDVHVPLAQARTIKEGKTARVQFPDPDQTSTQGKITFISTVADVGTLKVRVEVANSDNRPAGEQIRVIFSGLD